MGHQNLPNYWLLTTEYPPFFGGGISTYCVFTAKMLSLNGYTVSVIIPDPTVSDYVIDTKDNIRIIRFNTNRTNSNNFLGHTTNLSYEFAHIVKDLIYREGKPNIIESQEYLGIAYYLLQFKYLKYSWCQDIPVLITLHSPAFLYLEYNHVLIHAYPNYWIGEMERFCIKAADCLISPSKYLVNAIFEKFNFDIEKVHIIPNPYETTFKDITLPKNPTEIIFFGKLSAQKGVFKLLNYFQKIWDSGFNESLTLIGGQDIFYYPEGKTMGSYIKERYGKYIKNNLLKLENKVPPSQTQTRLSNAKLIIVPSTVDNLPYVVLEMMSLGLIVLASEQGGQSEVIENGVNGFLFSHDSPNTFFNKLNEILSLTVSERLRIGKCAQETVKNLYNFDNIFKNKKSVLTKVDQLLAPKYFPVIRLDAKTFTDRTELLQIHNNLLSIIIPYYNMGLYIDETINSIKKTSIVNKEIIIINDGSNDSFSINKLSEYRNNPDIKIIDVENSGLGAARNLGAQLANGGYITFLDADDLISPDYYTKAVTVLQAYNNVKFVGAWTQYFDGSNNIWPTFNPEPPIILYHNTINSSALVYKKLDFLNLGLNDTNMNFQGLEDYESVIQLLSNGCIGVVLPEPLYYYRVRKGSMIRSISKTKKILLVNYISQKYEFFYSNFAAELTALVNSNGIGLEMDNPSLDYYFDNHVPFKNLLKKLVPLIKKNKLIREAAFKIYKLIRN